MNTCQYCEGNMYGQDNDNMGNRQYSKIYVCSNCKSVYEEWTDDKGISLRDKNRWWNPKTKEFEN